MMKLVHDEASLRPFLGGVLVPTMGALHRGHAALIERARDIARPASAPVVVWVFVNPAQFNDPKDFETYPRTLGADVAIAESAGANVVFAPSVEAVYPDELTMEPVALPAVATNPGLEDAHRPGHFEGVCRVCSRMFDMTDPTHAVFGEKDWQQLQVVRAMVRAQDRTLEIVPHETVREADGLALSSRNVRLGPEARGRAVALSLALGAAGRESTPQAGERAGRDALDHAGVETEYFVVRDAESLLAPRAGRPARALVAGVVGGVRLIDNAPWPGPR